MNALLPVKEKQEKKVRVSIMLDESVRKFTDSFSSMGYGRSDAINELLKKVMADQKKGKSSISKK